MKLIRLTLYIYDGKFTFRRYEHEGTVKNKVVEIPVDSSWRKVRRIKLEDLNKAEIASMDHHCTTLSIHAWATPELEKEVTQKVRSLALKTAALRAKQAEEMLACLQCINDVEPTTKELD